jgi:hypothetical protein
MNTKITAYDYTGEIISGFPIKCARFGVQTQSAACYVYKSEIPGSEFDMVVAAPAIIIETPIEKPPDDTDKQLYHIRMYANANKPIFDWLGIDITFNHHWTAFTAGAIKYSITGTIAVNRMGKS